MALYSQHPTPNYQNPIKEAISAVEAVNRNITGDSTLNLKKMEGKGLSIPSVLTKSFNVLYTFSIPIIIGTTIFSSSIIEIIAGQEYQGAIIPMMIVMPLLVIIGAEQILVIQLLILKRK